MAAFKIHAASIILRVEILTLNSCRLHFGFGEMRGCCPQKLLADHEFLFCVAVGDSCEGHISHIAMLNSYNESNQRLAIIL